MLPNKSTKIPPIHQTFHHRFKLWSGHWLNFSPSLGLGLKFTFPPAPPLLPCATWPHMRWSLPSHTKPASSVVKRVTKSHLEQWLERPLRTTTPLSDCRKRETGGHWPYRPAAARAMARFQRLTLISRPSTELTESQKIGARIFHYKELKPPTAKCERFHIINCPAWLRYRKRRKRWQLDSRTLSRKCAAVLL